MTAEQLEAIAGGANPASVGMDCEEAITYLASRVLAAEKLVGGLSRILDMGSNVGEKEADELDALIAAYREASK